MYTHSYCMCDEQQYTNSTGQRMNCVSGIVDERCRRKRKNINRKSILNRIIITLSFVGEKARFRGHLPRVRLTTHPNPLLCKEILLPRGSLFFRVSL